MATMVDYPFHLGVTEAGTAFGGSIKSAIGLEFYCTKASAIRFAFLLPLSRTKKCASAGKF
jgi:hypothetical protein